MSISEIDVFLLEIGHNGPGVLLACYSVHTGILSMGLKRPGR